MFKRDEWLSCLRTRLFFFFFFPSDAVEVIFLNLCMMLTFIRLYMFIAVSGTLTDFQGLWRVWKKLTLTLSGIECEMTEHFLVFLFWLFLTLSEFQAFSHLVNCTVALLPQTQSINFILFDKWIGILSTQVLEAERFFFMLRWTEKERFERLLPVSPNK